MLNRLTGPQLLARVEALLPEHRERRFPPTLLLAIVALLAGKLLGLIWISA
ncbi:hypothetical protein [uncultured Thiocystis sp.]|jgi:hypothetical protein|uniref:hypothetical protein n=1 Tax=uncultured Thiocystis sp. TaxID=1202134 RepID=UPI0025CE42EA|nr:hypothetical protein [uncultured Thiocystis sp.]